MYAKRPKIVVVRDGEPDAVRNPPPTTFTRFTDVTYRHLMELSTLPGGSHYFFNCNVVDERVYALANQARGAGANLTFIVRHIDHELARFVEETHAGLIPAYGVANHITQATVCRAVRRVLAGHRVVATGFLQNSLARSPHNEAPTNMFVRLLIEASRLAHGSARVVAAVLSLHRTGSNFLRDLIGLTVSSRVGVFHEHEVPPASGVRPDRRRPIFDQVFLEADQIRARLLRRTCLREMILNADCRFIFVAERPPDERLTSYFVKRHIGWLRSHYDRQRCTLGNLREIQQAFDDWLETSVRVQRSWYRKRLVETFGLNVLEASRTDDGFLLSRRAANTLLVMPTACLDTLGDELASVFGTDVYGTIARNSVRTEGIASEIDRAFRRQVYFPAAIAEALWQIPEVAHLHPRRVSAT
jgi:hypothetical protein